MNASDGWSPKVMVAGIEAPMPACRLKSGGRPGKSLGGRKCHTDTAAGVARLVTPGVARRVVTEFCGGWGSWVVTVGGSGVPWRVMSRRGCRTESMMGDGWSPWRVMTTEFAARGS